MSAAALVPAAGWVHFLAELAAKATLVLMLTALAAALLWRSSAAVRHMVWCTGVAGVLALPVLSAVVPAWKVPLLPASASAAPASPVDALPAVRALPGRAASPALPTTLSHADPAGTPTMDAAPAPGAWVQQAVALVAGAGVLLGALWLAVGFYGVARLGCRAEVVSDAAWLRAAHEAAERLGLRRPVLLLRSRGAAMPATWGLLWPSVVLPAAAEGWDDDRRRAVLAHELAHVKRFDCLTQALAQVACVLLWWHPAVWYAAKRLRVERERACDDLVLGAGARASDYAAHLLEIARAHRTQWMAAPAMVSMARPSQLESRLLWVLDGARARTVPSARAALLSVAVGAMVVGPLAAMRPVEASAMPLLSASDLAAAPSPHRPAAADEAGGEALGVFATARGREPAGPAIAVDGKAKEKARAPRAAGDTVPGQRSIDDLIAMRAVGVDAAFIEEMRAAGFTRLTSRELVSMKATGVSGAYAAQMRAAGFTGLDPEALVGLRAVGVTPAYLDDLRRRGYTGLSADDAKGMRAVGVDAAYIDQMNAAGFGHLTADQLTGFRAVGVTAAYLGELALAGLSTRDAHEVQGMRAVGVTGEYVAQMKAAGLEGLDAETVTGLRAVGVTPEYLRELAGVGITGLNTHQATEMRVHGVTADYVRQMRAAGFAAATPEQLVRLRVSGIDRELLRSRGRDTLRETTKM